ncbi:MAG: cytochrome c, partial [Planctomycetes bacterium]|nr:cytochrome c [Planctomycetota bacterium]
PSQREIDQRDADRIEEGRELLVDWGCTDCHRFGDEGDHVGPDLTGYGSAEWIGQFISDPADEDTGVRRKLRFYGDENYGMPSYRRFRPEEVAGKSPEEVDMKKQLADKERLNLLTVEEVEALVGLLRGELAEGEE